MRQQCDRVAGLDVHRDSVVVCARIALGDGDVEVIKRRFPATQAGLVDLARFLAETGVTTVAMEATGVYWKPVFYVLEDLFDEVWLCNAHHVKNVPGRKTDMADSEWLADVVAHGMVRPSFVPPPPIRELRDLTRYRKTLVDERTREIQRLEKVLQDAGVKLTSVASSVWGVSTRKMIEALIAGEREPQVLAELAQSRMRAKRSQLADALPGRFSDHHGFMCAQIIAHIDFLSRSIDQVSADIAARVGPFESAVRVLTSIPGIQTWTAQVIIAEIGVDMTRWPTAGHLCAWAGVAPASHESAGKHKPAGTRHGARWLRRTLTEAAWAASRSHDTYYQAQYRRIARRRGHNKAVIAVANSMLATIWHLLSTGTATYNDPGGAYFETLNDPAREAKRLTRRLENLGYTVTIAPTAA